MDFLFWAIFPILKGHSVQRNCALVIFFPLLRCINILYGNVVNVALPPPS